MLISQLLGLVRLLNTLAGGKDSREFHVLLSGSILRMFLLYLHFLLIDFDLSACYFI